MDNDHVSGLWERSAAEWEREMHPSHAGPDGFKLPEQMFVAGYNIDDEAYEVSLPVGRTLLVASIVSAVFWTGVVWVAGKCGAKLVGQWLSR